MVEWPSQEGQLAGRQSIQSMYGVLGRSKSVSNLDTGGTSARGRGMMSRSQTIRQYPDQAISSLARSVRFRAVRCSFRVNTLSAVTVLSAGPVLVHSIKSSPLQQSVTLQRVPLYASLLARHR